MTALAKYANRRAGGRGYAGGKDICAGVRAELSWREIYCAKPRPDPGFHSGSWSYRGLGRISPLIIWEYNLTTTIAIWFLTQPCTCEKGSSRFFAVSGIKFVSTKRAFFPRMPSTENTNR